MLLQSPATNVLVRRRTLHDIFDENDNKGLVELESEEKIQNRQPGLEWNVSLEEMRLKRFVWVAFCAVYRDPPSPLTAQ